jgi:DnaK suppressor protein
MFCILPDHPIPCIAMALTTEQKKELRSIIEQMTSETGEELVQLVEYTRPVSPDSSIGRISRMDAINNKAINDAAFLEKKKLLQKLEKTLDRLADTGFDNCNRCGEPIAFGRLQIMPYTRRCVRCSGR